MDGKQCHTRDFDARATNEELGRRNFVVMYSPSTDYIIVHVSLPHDAWMCVREHDFVLSIWHDIVHHFWGYPKYMGAFKMHDAH